MYLWKGIHTHLATLADNLSLIMVTNLVATLQMEITGPRMETQIDPVSVVSYDIFSTWILISSSLHQLLQPLGEIN